MESILEPTQRCFSKKVIEKISIFSRPKNSYCLFCFAAFASDYTGWKPVLRCCRKN